MDLIERARLKLAAAQQRLRAIQDEKERLEGEADRWATFIADAESLAKDAGREVGPRLIINDAPIPPSGGGPQLVEGSHAAVAARLILKNGPMTLDQLLDAMRDMGRGTDDPSFRANVSSALWRRREDVFNREEKDGPYALRTTDFVFVPPPSGQADKKGTTKQ